MRAALAVDLGGTELRAGIVAADGALIARRTVSTRLQGGPEAVLAQIEELVAALRQDAPGCELLGLGVGAPGPLDLERGVVVAAPMLRGWADVPLVALLRKRFGCRVALDNDANAAALGEWRFGAGRGTRHMVFVTVSTGIGGGVIVDGRLLHGRRGMAGEVGHMAVCNSEERCACGSTGCWEMLASGTALGRLAARAAASDATTVLRAISGDMPLTAWHVAAAARQDDAVACRLLADEARFLGIGFANLLHLYAPERLVVGGGVSACLDLLLPGIEATVRRRAMPAYRDIPIVRAALGRHAGLVGAGCLILHGAADPAREAVAS